MSPSLKHTDGISRRLFLKGLGACWDADGNICVLEWISAGRVTKLRKMA